MERADFSGPGGQRGDGLDTGTGRRGREAGPRRHGYEIHLTAEESLWSLTFVSFFTSSHLRGTIWGLVLFLLSCLKV